MSLQTQTNPYVVSASKPSSGDTETVVVGKPKVSTAPPWAVVIYDDPVNFMDYVTMCIQRIFGYSRERAKKHMLEVHQHGRSQVWSGNKEKAELYVHQLHAAQLQASLERAGE